MTKIELIGTVIGTLVLNKVIVRLQGYYGYWKFNREFRNAQKRLSKCSHVKTKMVNIGTDEHPYMAEKCVSCWGLKLFTSLGHNTPTREWTANNIKPD